MCVCVCVRVRVDVGVLNEIWFHIIIIWQNIYFNDANKITIVYISTRYLVNLFISLIVSYFLKHIHKEYPKFQDLNNEIKMKLHFTN
jgi:hypothetical protein